MDTDKFVLNLVEIKVLQGVIRSSWHSGWAENPMPVYIIERRKNEAKTCKSKLFQ